MKVAYYSPLPPSRSGIADYSALLLPALRERVDVVVAEPGKRAPAADVALYHVGNDPDAHGWIVDALQERPGLVVLHEHVLHHLIAGITIGRSLKMRKLSSRGSVFVGVGMARAADIGYLQGGDERFERGERAASIVVGVVWAIRTIAAV